MLNPFSIFTQAFPPRPQFTEKDIPDLSGRVCIVTGANTGVGKEVAQILYSKNATVYATSRSEEKGRSAIVAIKEAVPNSTGKLDLLTLDLADLTTIKPAADTFLAKETQLHLLINNAGVMMPPQGSKTAQGYELQLGTNCVGPFLFSKLLTPTLVQTAKTALKDSVRIVWVSSSAAEVLSPCPAIEIDNLDYNRDRIKEFKYGISKAGNYFHSTEFAKRHKADGVISLALNPGNLSSELDRHITALIPTLFRKATTYPAINGAYTELFAALSPDVTIEKTVIPWGRFYAIRDDLVQGSKSREEGGTGLAEDFWRWTEEQVAKYL
ncbi:short-chain dehydrogenase [Colletotrichum orchidophilum]|uniref:Short-chain dehydrogenase n=1 Tax=Colletotrichum orchidophilum TaxID=1209926 RepID=A0A1G4AVZ6_9PEZI|nr:short-chain dehydrogenase [Colletotrichum orchidophilum]OHE93276.1 short-chain dehydrogenase [Colletotrichum orchidophilum]